MDNIDPAKLVILASKTGLSQRTCEDLLLKGWTYVEQTEEVPRWSAPVGRIQGDRTR